MNFAIISRPELNLLIELPKSAICVYLALASYCRDHSNCFPSINTIKSLLSSSGITERTIYKALAMLEDKGLIKRAHRRSTNRFVLRVREIWMNLRKQATEGNGRNGQGQQGETNTIKREPKKNLRNRGKKNKRSGFLDQLRPAAQTDEDRIEEELSQFVLADIAAPDLFERLTASMREWLRNYHPHKFDALVRGLA
jgi:DNA-binding transcriptional ArsR family regulator